MTIAAPKIPAPGRERRRHAGGLAHGVGAELSVAADPDECRLSARRRRRHRRARRWQSLSVRLGQPVVIENRPGAGGNVAGEATAKAAPDGYTMMHGPDNLFMANPHLYAKMSFDPLKDLVPVSSLISNQLVLAVHPSVPANNLREFVELARKTKPPLFYASIGNGSQHHLAMEILKQHVGIDLTHVPYRGGGPAGIALIAGEISAMFGAGSIVPVIQSGKARGLAASGAKRFRADAGAADHQRDLSRLRGADLARPVRAGRRAAADHGAAARRGAARCSRSPT